MTSERVGSDTLAEELFAASAAFHGSHASGGVRASGLVIAWQNGVPQVPEDALARRVSEAAKRLMDVILSLIALVVLAPLLIATALLIKLTSPGPVLFAQLRTGFRGETFTIYKFRSMYVDRCDQTGSVQAATQDARVTPVGRLIRRLNIDEFPQLFNVLQGTMSLVGPRPYPLGMPAGRRPYREIAPFFDFRESMKPGLSGWAQANGYRGPTDDVTRAYERLLHDVAYIQNFSILLDLKIIVLTIAAELFGGHGF